MIFLRRGKQATEHFLPFSSPARFFWPVKFTPLNTISAALGVFGDKEMRENGTEKTGFQNQKKGRQNS